MPLYNTIQYNTIQYNTIQHNTIKYNTCLSRPIIIYNKYIKILEIKKLYNKIHVEYASGRLLLRPGLVASTVATLIILT